MAKNARKLLSLLLALVMALSLAVPAIAAEDEQPEKELRWVHLDWDENGRCFANPDALKTDDPGLGNETGYDLYRQDAVLFFIWNNRTNKRERYVVPAAGDGLVVEKIAGVARNAIAPGAQQSQYYVWLSMTQFKDSEVTANGLSFTVRAELPDFGFYTSETALSGDTMLAHETTPDRLTGDALYLVEAYRNTDQAADHETVTAVEKGNPEDDDSRKGYDIEKVEDGLWKIAINDVGKVMLEQGRGINVYLSLTIQCTDEEKSTYQWGGGVFIHGEEQTPQLWFVHLRDEWDDEGQQSFFFNENDTGCESQTAQVHAGEDYARFGFFATLADGQDPWMDGGKLNTKAFTPVDVKTLETDDGVTVESVAGQAKKGETWAKYFVKVSVAENGKEYQVASGDYAITIDSNLPEVGVYSAPTASFDTWLGEWGYGFHPVYADEPYYIISTATTGAGNYRRLTDAKLSTENLPEDSGNALVDLEKVSDDVYKLSFKKDADLKADSFHVDLDLTWTDFMGNTYTDEHCYFGNFDPRAVIVASETALPDTAGNPKPFAGIADKVSTSLTMEVGVEKEAYLYACGLRQGEFMYSAFDAESAALYRSSDEALTIVFDEKDPAKFTLSASKPGTYEVWIGQPYDVTSLRLSHTGGKAYTDAEMDQFNLDYSWSLSLDGKLLIRSGDEFKPFEEVFPGESYTIDPGEWDYGFLHLTVTAENPAKTFTDVPEGEWYEEPVNWAVKKGITVGTTDTTFSPLKDCKQAEILTFLWRAAGEPECGALLPFVPKNAYAAPALLWAYEKGMIGDSFDDDAPCTRADAVMYIWQAMGKPAASYDGRFTDVAKDAAYASAVAWAVDTGVTQGTTAETFTPDKVCNRGTIVTLLYRAYSN